MKIVIYFDCNGNQSLASAECGVLIKPAAAALATVSNIQGRQECHQWTSCGRQELVAPSLIMLRNSFLSEKECRHGIRGKQSALLGDITAQLTDNRGHKMANGKCRCYLILDTVAMATEEGLCRPWTIATLI